MFTYRIAGLTVVSELVLPGLIEAPQLRGDSVVAIRRGDVPTELDGAVTKGPVWSMSAELFLLSVPGVARFLMREGREIIVEPENGRDIEDATIFLMGSAFGILLHQRRAIVLHASAVKVNGKAVVFCGHSGVGKSTLAAALGKRGYSLVADDICAINIDGNSHPIVHPGGRQLKLWQQAIDELELGSNRGQSVRNRIEKFYVKSKESISEPLPLAAIYALSEALPPFGPGIEKPNLVETAIILRRGTYRPKLIRRMGQIEHYFAATAKIVANAGVFHLRRVMDFAEIPSTIDCLEQHWSDIGLTAEAAA